MGTVKPVSTNGAAQQSRPRIARWEYLTLAYNSSYGSTTYNINGEKDGNLKNKELHEVLTYFGRQGWELVSIAGAEGKDFVFKRPAMQ